MAGGEQIDLEKVAREQQIKYQEEMEKILAAVKAKHEPGQLKEQKILTTGRKEGEITAVTEPQKNAGAVKENFDAAKASAVSELMGSQEKANIKNIQGDGTVQVNADDSSNNKDTKPGHVDFVKVTGKVNL